jgi:hypothetical protein
MRSVLLVALTLANGAAGFALQLLIARSYGVGIKSDAYFGALAAPLFCVGLFTAQSTFSAVPALMSRAARGRKIWLVAARSYMLTSVAIGSALALIGSLLWPRGLLWTVVGMHRGSGTALGVLCWIYGATQFPLVAAVALLQSRHRYLVALLAMAVPPLFTCLAMVALPHLDIVAVPAFQAVATAACALVASATLLRRGPGTAGNGGGEAGFGMRTVVESPYAVATLACFSIYAVIDSTLLPIFASGFLTSANVCQRLVIGLGQLVIAAPLTLITRDLVASIQARDPAGFQKSLVAALGRVLRNSLLLALVLYLGANAIMHVILSSRNKDSLDTLIAARTLRQMLPGMVLMLASNILVRSALTIPGLVRKTWWLGVAWGGLYAASVLLISTKRFNGSGYSYSIAWGITSVLLACYLRRVGPAAIADSGQARA